MTTRVFIIAFTAIWLQACQLLPIETRSYYIYRVENQTGYRMDIEAYEKGELVGEIHLGSGESMERFRETKNHGYLFTGSVDSISIRFGDLRQLIQYCDGNELDWAGDGGKCPEIIKNLCSNSAAITEGIYKKVKRKEVTSKYTYIFDNTDFERAEPIQE